jgi:hypothetical protein
MPAVIDILGICVIGVVIYLFYRLISVEKDRDLKRREEEIKRKDQEIERLKREIDVYK